MLSSPIVVIDFETTGLSPNMGDRVTEVAALRIFENRVVDKFVTLINCGVRIPSFITDMTGITQAMVNSAPPVSEVVPQLLAFIAEDPLCAHNGSFDEKFLKSECARLNLAGSHKGMVCTVKLTRRLFPGFPTYSLGPVAQKFGITFSGNAHRALADAEVASSLLIHLAGSVRERLGVSEIAPTLLQKITRIPASKVPAFLEKQKSERIPP